MSARDTILVTGGAGIEVRREVCWETFFEMTEVDLVKLRSA